MSTKVQGGDTLPGIIILQVNINKIKKLLKNNTEIIGSDGIYRISSNQRIKTKYKYFNKIDINDNKLNRFQITHNTFVLYNHFKFKNISKYHFFM